MTNQEIREKVVELLVDGTRIDFDDNNRISIFADAKDNNTNAKQKASIDEIVKLLTANGYKITLNELKVEKEKGQIKSSHSVILREEE